MKSSLEQEETLSTTTEGKNISISQLKEKSYLFNHIDKLAADHNVKVSNTMIKVTYKKALKDHYASLYDTKVETSSQLVLNENNMNMSEVCKRKTGETVNLCNSDSPLVPSSVKSQILAKAVFHSTPKQQAAVEKKREYVNGLNLTLKQTKCKNDSLVNLSKVQKMAANKSSDSLNPRIKSLDTGRSTNLRFLKDIRVVKVKDSIINKNSDKVKKPGVEMKKVDSGVKSRTEGAVNKRKKLNVRKKSSNVDVNVVTRKIKSSENKTKGGESSNKTVEDTKRESNKKAIMLVDPELPSGWTRFIRTKNKGSASEQHVVYVVSPQGKKFRFKWKLRKFLERTNSSLDADQFFFGLYKRPKSSYVPERNENSAESKSRKNSVLHISSKNESFHKVPVRGSLKTSSTSESRILSENQGRASGAEAEKNAGKVFGADGRELLHFDPDLPFGWKRIIHSNNSNGRLQVHIISPEGRIFRRRYRLNEYLMKHQYTHNLDRFYFGLYPKKEGNGTDFSSRESEDVKILHGSSDENNEGGEGYSTDSDNEDDSNDFIVSEADVPTTPMYDDPNLPEGWKRFIKIRSFGESAGRMEVVIVSPDGRKHRSKGHLEQYLQQENLGYKADDFDFTVFGKSGGGKKRPAVSEPREFTFGMKKKFSDKPVQPLDIDSLKDVRVTPEGEMINTVTGLMMSCGLTSIRAERRLRVPRSAHEKALRSQLDAEREVMNEGCQIPLHWIERLVKCRSDFRVLEPDAVSTIAERTKEFIKELSLRALITSENPEGGLLYDDVAKVVNGSECLSPLQTLIPKKLTYREYIRLNRPKQFMSFT